MSWSAGCDIDDLTGIVFSRLSSLVIDGVAEQESVIVVRAGTASWSGPFSGRGPVEAPAPWSGSVGDGLLRAVLELGFVQPPQVPYARRRKHRSDCGEVDRGCDPEGTAHPDPSRHHPCEGESERLAQQGAEPVIGTDARE